MTEENNKVNKYSHSKVYKLQCDDGYYYIGSTVNNLNQRLGDHKRKAKTDVNRKIYEHINEIGWERVRVILISEHNLENKDQLLREEDNVINQCKDDLFCLNMYRAFTGLNREDYYRKYREENKEKIKEHNKEYKENNKEKIKEKGKEYREENKDKRKEYYIQNKDKINEQRTEKIECICGSIFRRSDKIQHENTKKHNNYINSTI